MKTLNAFIVSAIIAGAVMAQAQSVEAQTNQYGQYGQYGQPTIPGQTIIIDKLIAEPGTATHKGGVTAGIFRDNLPANGERFMPGEEIVFKLVVKNITNTTLQNISVVDRVPEFVEPLVGPGTYNSANRTITYVIKELKPGVEDVAYIRMKVYAQNKLPANQILFAQVNNAEATANGQKDQDSAQYFVEKQQIAVNQVPKTGPAMGLALLALQGLGLAIGLKLRTHSSK